MASQPQPGQTWLHYTDGQPDVQLPSDRLQPSPARGDGIILGDGQRYRVADVWLVVEGDGRLSPGRHLIIEPESSLGTLVHTAGDDH